jgi:hypothetical protein
MATRVLLRRDTCGERPSPLPRPRMHRRAAVVFAFLLSAAVMMAMVPSAGAGVLDQSQPAVINTVVDVWDSDFAAQTFTNGITGGLDQVDLAVARSATAPAPPTFIVEIWRLSGGLPIGPPLGSPALASASVAATSLPLRGPFPPGFLSVKFVPPAPVTAGVQYAIVLPELQCSVGTNDCFGWYVGPPGDPYPAGSGFTDRSAGRLMTWTPLSVLGSTDFAFKTYVATQPTRKGQCKKGGWRRFTNPSFKNQGQCVKFVNHHNGKGGKGKDSEKSRGKKSGKKK